MMGGDGWMVWLDLLISKGNEKQRKERVVEERLIGLVDGFALVSMGSIGGWVWRRNFASAKRDPSRS